MSPLVTLMAELVITDEPRIYIESMITIKSDVPIPIKAVVLFNSNATPSKLDRIRSKIPTISHADLARNSLALKTINM